MTVVAVTGASGQVGSALCRQLGDRAVRLDRRALDLADHAAIGPTLRAIHPDVVINAAAYTAVDRAESEPDLANDVNGTAVGELASVCRELGARLVTYSTDYVFDGTKEQAYVESDATSPINAYGASKRLGEVLAAEALPSTLVLRTSWVMSGTHRNFASVILDKVRTGEVRVVDDQHGHPTFASDLAAGTLDAVERGAEGVLHLTNEGTATWFDVARHIATLAGIDPDRVQPCGTSDYPTPARRPANSVLDSERRDDLGVASMRHYTEPLAESIRALLEQSLDEGPVGSA